MQTRRYFFSGRLQRTTSGERCYWDTCGLPLWPPVDGLVCVLCTQRKDRSGDNDHTLDCAHCGKVVRISEMSDKHHEGLCKNCWAATRCEDCYHRGAEERRNGKYVCTPCSTERLFKCNDCGEHERQRVCLDNYSGLQIKVCSSCYEKRAAATPKSRFSADAPVFHPAPIAPIAPWRITAARLQAEKALL